jgi:molecular chaperone GrpE (heat shock protein)
MLNSWFKFETIPSLTTATTLVTPVQPSTPEDDDTKKELEPYTPNANEQTELLNELESLTDEDINILRLNTLTELDYTKRHLHYIVTSLQKNEHIAIEGFWEHPFITLRNIAGSLLNKFKVLLTLSLRDLKRSELRALKDSKSSSYSEVMKKELYQLQNISLPYPSGMEKITYFDALNRIQLFYDAVHMKEFSLRLKKSITDLIDFVSHSDLSQLDKTSSVKDKFTQLTDLKQLNLDVVKKVFIPILDINKDVVSTAKQIETKNEKLFPLLFKSVNEFREVYKHALKLEDRLKEVSSIYSNLQSIQSSVDKFVTALEKKSQTIHKNYVVIFAQYIEGIGQLFDMFGQAVHQHTRVDHNLVEVLKVMYSTFKL